MQATILTAIETALQEFSNFSVLCNEINSLQFSPKINLLAIGKSAFPMALAAGKCLNQNSIAYSGYLLTKYGQLQTSLPNLLCYEAGHPVSDENSLKYSKEIIAWLQKLPAEENLLILLSGGGSALFEVPAHGVSLQDLITLNKSLLHSGLNISEMNQERAKLSSVKSGKAMAYVTSRKVYCYMLSDVEGNDPSVMVSGPFFSERAKQTKMPQFRYSIVGDNLSYRNMLGHLLPKPNQVHEHYISDPVELSSGMLTEFACNLQNTGIHIFGGESPVTVQGTGKGGRCTHLALDFALKIAGKPDISLLCYATDGSDYLSGIAGAYVDGQTVSKLQALGIDPVKSLQNCDSFSVLHALGATISASQYAINVNDIYVLCLR